MQGAREEWLTGAGWSDALPARGVVSLAGSLEPWQAAARGEGVPASSEAAAGLPGSPAVFHPSLGAVDEAAERMFGEGDRLDALGERVYRP